jgi:hypothetical protein
MNVIIHDINGTQVAEMQSEGIIIRSARDAADIIGQLSARGIKKLILHERNLCPEFWQLSNGLAGVILQEFTNCSVAAALVGVFDQYKSKSLTAFIKESNLNNQVIFSDNTELVKMRLSKEL